MQFRELEKARVAILGMGREGQAVWRQIRSRYPGKPLSFFVESELDAGFSKQLDAAIDDCHVGPLDVDALKEFDVLVRSSGISPYRSELQQLRSLGVLFTTASNLWFAEHPDAKTICISGTMGKSTTAALIAHLLDQAGIKTCLAGNIGRPMLDCDDEGVKWWVIELSSYQISDLRARPDIAVLLNLSEEHLDWHQGVEAYRSDKLKLVHLVAEGRLIANYSDNVLIEHLQDWPGVSWFNKPGKWQAGKDRVFHRSNKRHTQDLSRDRTPAMGPHQVSAPASLPGAHNMQNLAAALTVLDEMSVSITDLGDALASFAGLPHRLQFLGEKTGIRYINDSISTTPLSAAAALQTIGHTDVVLLLGGMDRGLDWNSFAVGLLQQEPHAIITLPDNGPKIIDCLKAAGVKPGGGLHLADRLSEAVALARTLVPERGCILLSPGAPSFPHFRDFEDRGNQFKKLAGFK